MTGRVILSCVASLAALGCGDPAPRYGEATLSSAAPRATFSGTTFGAAAAMELAPGCPGYLDIETPGHVVHVSEDLPFDITVRSDDAPLALAVAHGDEVRCDSDEGSGHAPTLSFETAGDYQLFIAALREPAELSYEVNVRAGAARTEAVASTQGGENVVNVTITSQPPGAQVRDAGGRVVGTTPAMFVVHATAEQLGQPMSWTLSLPEHRPVTVSGELTTGALVLHGQLPSAGPTEIDVTSSQSQPIRDYQASRLGVDVAETCAVTAAAVEVDITHSFIGDLRVVLRPPWGDEIVLHRHSGGGRRNLRRTWRSDQPQLRPLLGRPAAGRWLLVVHDDAGADQGSLDRFRLRLTCGQPGVAVAPRPDGTRRTPVHVRPTSRPRPPRLPDLPTRTDIVRVLGALRPRVEQCGGGRGGSARVIATVSGSTGRVTEVSSSGVSDATVRGCVNRAVRSARFPRFRRSSLDVDYTYALR